MNEFIDILHVDDDQLYHELVRHVLEKEIGGSRVSEAASYPEFEARLTEGNYDLVLTDFNIFGLEGSQVFDAVRVVDPQAPVVIVTGPGSEGMAVEAVERGATDYVTKTPQSLRWLPHAVRAAIEQQRLQAEHKRAEEALHQSEQRFRQVVASISDHIYVTEVAEEGRHVNLYISPYVEALTGYPWEKFLADWSFWPSAVIHPDDRAAAAAQVSRL
ncbi:MAG TPA: response regulator, partial [Anaerolineae bacterium]|nr:response regulator [Anaerolineae bacterium]